MNRKIRQFEDDIISLLNGSDLPIEVKRLTIENILNLVTKEADKAILGEIHAQIESEGEDAEGSR